MPITDYNKIKKLDVTDINDPGASFGKAQPVILSGFETDSEDAFSSDENTADTSTVTTNCTTSTKMFVSKVSYGISSISGTDTDVTVEIINSNSNIVASKTVNKSTTGLDEINFSNSDYSSLLNNENFEIKVELSSGLQYQGTQTSSNTTIASYTNQNTTRRGTTVTQDFTYEFTEIVQDDSKTGNGDIVIDFTNISDAQDIAVYDQNGNLLDYEIEDLDTTSETATLWCYNSWVRDGSTQAQIAYGSNSANVDRQVSDVASNETGNIGSYWFNESSGDLIDHAGTKDGTVTGATQGVTGEFYNGYSFDGTDDYVSTGILQSDFVGESVAAIRGWFKTTTTQSQSGLVQGTANFDASFGLAINSEGGVKLEYYTDQDNFDAIDTGTSAYNDGNWHQFVVLVDLSFGEYEIYVDGTLDNSGSTVAGSTIGDSNGGTDLNIKIGARAATSENFYAGDVDQVDVYTGFRPNSDWIQADYDASPKAGQVFFSQQAAEDTAVTESGVANGSASLDGDATATNRISGVAPATATLNGDATATQTINIKAQATGNASLTGSGDMYKRVSVTSNGSATLNGDATASLGAIVSARATGTANLTGTSTATKIVQPVATGNASLTSDASGSLLVQVSADGDASLTTDAVGTTTELAQAVATGNASLTGSAIGSVPLTFRDSEITASIDKTTEKTLSGDIDK